MVLLINGLYSICPYFLLLLVLSTSHCSPPHAYFEHLQWWSKNKASSCHSSVASGGGGDLLTARPFVAWAYCSQTWETLQGSQRTCSYQASLYFYSGKKGHKRNNIPVSIEFRSPGRHWAREHSELLPQSLLSVSNLGTSDFSLTASPNSCKSASQVALPPTVWTWMSPEQQRPDSPWKGEESLKDEQSPAMTLCCQGGGRRQIMSGVCTLGLSLASMG